MVGRSNRRKPKEVKEMEIEVETEKKYIMSYKELARVLNIREPIDCIINASYRDELTICVKGKGR